MTAGIGLLKGWNNQNQQFEDRNLRNAVVARVPEVEDLKGLEYMTKGLVLPV